MAKARIDQAEGLRRLREQDRLRIVSVNAASSGDIGTIINLAGALSEIGSDVVILDERTGSCSVAEALGLHARFDLDEVIKPGRSLDDMIVRGPAGIRVLPLSPRGLCLPNLSERELRALRMRLGRIETPVDTFLVDTAPGRASSFLSPAAVAQEVIILAGDGADEITASYALIKRLCNDFGRREFHVLVSNVASETRARTLVDKMAGVARRFLRASIDFMGHVPPDEKLQRAARLRLPVVAAFPNAVAAVSFRDLAQTVVGWPHGEDEACGLDDMMGRLIQSHNLRAAA